MLTHRRPYGGVGGGAHGAARARQLLADAIPFRRGTEPLKVVSEMTPAVVAAVCEAVCEAARGLVMGEVTGLARAHREMERRNARMSQAAKFQVRCDLRMEQLQLAQYLQIAHEAR
jgi:hypothetical protein